MIYEPNKVNATLKVVVAAEFYDDEATEETLRCAVEQYLEDAGFDVDVSLLKEQNWVKCSDRMPEEHDSIFAKLKGTDKWRSAMFEKSSEDVRIVEVFEDGTRRMYHSHTIDGKWDIEKQPIKRTVTHWMPNPKLPKGSR